MHSLRLRPRAKLKVNVLPKFDSGNSIDKLQTPEKGEMVCKPGWLFSLPYPSIHVLRIKIIVKSALT